MKKPLWCWLGFHRYGPWTWEDEPRQAYSPLGTSIPEYVQRRCCQDCLKVQGPLISSEQRHYYESWRDRIPVGFSYHEGDEV